MNTRVHAPYLVPGWEMCLLSVNPPHPKGTALDGSNHGKTGIQEKDICRETIRIFLSLFIFKDTSKTVLRTNKGDHGPRQSEHNTVFFFLRFYNVFFGLCSLVFSFCCTSPCFITSLQWLWKCSPMVNSKALEKES